MNFLSFAIRGSGSVIRCTVLKKSSQSSISLLRAFIGSSGNFSSKATDNDNQNRPKMEKFDKQSLKERLTPLQYHVTQEAGTERPFSGKYNKCYEKGTYICIVCSQELFNSDNKYDSGCGWPAFNDVLEKGKVTLHSDPSLVGGNLLLLIARPGLVRTEVRCSKCNSHLGHVFEDGPKPTRKRYCINSASIEFMEAGSERKPEN